MDKATSLGAGSLRGRTRCLVHYGLFARWPAETGPLTESKSISRRCF
ncbi:hypothetical protein RISK_000375 [Rhodopirellula islandica]|uniref:Uncharacterized protein n=1 Tax=Rhodopirellula islandica TaxID=595434 RepID=A0A0J1BLB1_RHOIS|nr:hypothetical protein RISK_000375 [Rhodopirellula islandica]